MYWGVGGGKRRCFGGVGSVLGCGKVWGGVGSCVEVCLGRGEMCLGCGERCGKGVGVRGRIVGQSGRAGKFGEKSGVMIWNPNFLDPTPSKPPLQLPRLQPP